MIVTGRCGALRSPILETDTYSKYSKVMWLWYVTTIEHEGERCKLSLF